MEIDKLLTALRNKYARLSKNVKERESFLLHLKSLARWSEEPLDYPAKTNIEFPDTLQVAYGVCHPECGGQEFLIDGSTQECQHCGGLMFRSAVATYKLKDKAPRKN